jgi:NAD(P)-dependent dehydrogenase (short-subunit alcohol dehydrogenase family)
MKKKIIILGANADIGFNIASMYADDGFEVVGTYRKENENSISLRKRSNVSLFQLDVFNKSDTLLAFKYAQEHILSKHNSY